MPTITALVHTQNDALRLGRCLEMLYACDDVLIIDHQSHDDTLRVAREYGARVIVAAGPHRQPVPADLISSGWILCLEPRESVSESLSASLYEYRSGSYPMPAGATFSVRLREETASGWQHHPTPETRLVPANWDRWNGWLPAHRQESQLLPGDLLRFAFP